MSDYYLADRDDQAIRVYSCDDQPRLVATIRTVDDGTLDQLLNAYGWKRLGPWQTQGHTPPDHAVATLVPQPSAVRS